jgi:hypothetical protein
MLDHLLLGERRVAAHDRDAHDLAGLLVGARHGAHLEHARHHRDHVLDLVRVHVEAGDQDHVLLAVDDLHVALGRHEADVAGAERAVGVITLAVSSSRFQ